MYINIIVKHVQKYPIQAFFCGPYFVTLLTSVIFLHERFNNGLEYTKPYLVLSNDAQDLVTSSA